MNFFFLVLLCRIFQKWGYIEESGVISDTEYSRTKPFHASLLGKIRLDCRKSKHINLGYLAFFMHGISEASDIYKASAVVLIPLGNSCHHYNTPTHTHTHTPFYTQSHTHTPPLTNNHDKIKNGVALLHNFFEVGIKLKLFLCFFCFFFLSLWSQNKNVFFFSSAFKSNFFKAKYHHHLHFNLATTKKQTSECCHSLTLKTG